MHDLTSRFEIASQFRKILEATATKRFDKGTLQRYEQESEQSLFLQWACQDARFAISVVKLLEPACNLKFWTGVSIDFAPLKNELLSCFKL